MKTRILGNSGLEVSAFGLGCMGMSWSYGVLPEKKIMIKLLRDAVERGLLSLILLKFTDHYCSNKL